MDDLIQRLTGISTSIVALGASLLVIQFFAKRILEFVSTLSLRYVSVRMFLIFSVLLHEVSHAAMAIVMGHKVTKIKVGHVGGEVYGLLATRHSGNTWQTIGGPMIALAPLLFPLMIISAILYVDPESISKIMWFALPVISLIMAGAALSSIDINNLRSGSWIILSFAFIVFALLDTQRATAAIILATTFILTIVSFIYFTISFLWYILSGRRALPRHNFNEL